MPTHTGSRAARKAAELLEGLAKVFGARAMAPVASAQISGVSYATVGRAGLELIEDLARDGRVAVPAMLNPCGMDPARWREMGVDEEFAAGQRRVLDAYAAMGVELTCTCTPYLAGRAPARGDILAWGESSAVAYVNSVIGARTNREGGPAALAAALVGATPVYGLHLDENRRPAVAVAVDARLSDASDYGALAVALARAGVAAVPLFRSAGGAPPPAGLRALSAALPTWTGAGMFHWEEATPEWDAWPRPAAGIVVGEEALAAARASLRDEPGTGGAAGEGEGEDLVFTGCPHLGIEEVAAVARLLAGRRVRRPLWVCTSRAVREEARRAGHEEAIERAGGRLFCDTCFVVSPRGGRFASVVTDSAKACYYCRGMQGTRVRLATVEECAARALGDGR